MPAVSAPARRSSTLSGSQQEYLRRRVRPFHRSGFGRRLAVGRARATASDPGYNATGCGACHSQPAAGGTSPRADTYPFVGAESADRGRYGIRRDQRGALVRACRTALCWKRAFRSSSMAQGHLTTTRDGGVHAIYTIAGRSRCARLHDGAAELRSDAAARQSRVPHSDAGVRRGTDREHRRRDDPRQHGRQCARSSTSSASAGHPNTSGNDGSITRFGWKAQNKSLEIFSGEAYNVEMGVSNELFPNERANPPANCMYNATPEDRTNFEEAGAGDHERHGRLHGLHALPRAAHAVEHRHPGQSVVIVDPARTSSTFGGALRPLPHADVADGGLDVHAGDSITRTRTCIRT